MSHRFARPVPIAVAGGDTRGSVGENGDVTAQPAETLTPTVRWASIVGVWIGTVIAAVLIGVFTDLTDYLSWLGIAMAGSVLVTMCVQLATQERRGFVLRLGASVSGSFVILAVATLALYLFRS